MHQLHITWSGPGISDSRTYSADTLDNLAVSAHKGLLSGMDSEVLIPRVRHISLWQWRFRYWNGEGPVPGTRKSRGGYAFYRRPKTQAERRANQGIPEDGEPVVRGARKPHSLPSAWDDIRRSRVERNWKSQHKGQKAWDH